MSDINLTDVKSIHKPCNIPSNIQMNAIAINTYNIDPYCDGSVCQKRNTCVHHIHSTDPKIVREFIDYSVYGSSGSGSNNDKTYFWCGDNGNYLLYKPVNKTEDSLIDAFICVKCNSKNIGASITDTDVILKCRDCSNTVSIPILNKETIIFDKTTDQYSDDCE